MRLPRLQMRRPRRPKRLPPNRSRSKSGVRVADRRSAGRATSGTVTTTTGRMIAPLRAARLRPRRPNQAKPLGKELDKARSASVTGMAGATG